MLLVVFKSSFLEKRAPSHYVGILCSHKGCRAGYCRCVHADQVIWCIIHVHKTQIMRSNLFWQELF